MYEYPLYRPPSEARSLILQITSGCSYNKCTFCSMYKSKQFKVKTYEEIEKHILWAKQNQANPQKIFLADGNVLCLNTDLILKILTLIKNTFPHVKRISSYAGPRDLLKKSPDELAKIKAAGLDMLYLGVESGSDKVLQAVNKGVSREEMITAGVKAKKAGFILSCMIISGLGGKEFLEEHALESSKAISAINPDYFSLLTLMLEKDAPLRDQVAQGELELLSPHEIMLELKMMLENIDLEQCVFRTNHASNYINLKGTLNKDKNKLLQEINLVMETSNFKPESWRGL